MVVAPVLSIIAWFAVDAYIGEQPHSAKKGSSYPLVAESNCRYSSGQCTLSNEDFSLRVTFAQSHYLISSDFPLSKAFIGVANVGDEPMPSPMEEREDGSWVSSEVGLPEAGDQMYVVVESSGVRFYGDASVTFLLPER